jgi:SNF2 family DNA or RNA helicase
MVLEEILFSRTTFQGVCKDDGEEYYPLIQLSHENDIISSLCSCGSEAPICKHAELLFENVVTSPSRNISQEFDDSFIKAFFYHFFYFHEESLINCKLKKNTLEVDFDKDVLEFHAHHDDLTHIQTILLNEEIKDETNSLEFSSLPEEELRLYENKRPSFNLRFALSVYNDLAKYLFLKKSEKGLRIVLNEVESSHVNMEITIDGVSFHAKIKSELLKELIPQFYPSITKTPLHQGSIDYKIELVFDERTSDLLISRKKRDLKAHDTVDLGEFVFIKDFGFYAKKLDSLFESDRIDDIPQFFKKYRSHIGELLVGATVHPEKEKAHYKLDMTDKGELKIFLDRAGPFVLNQTQDHLFKPFVLIGKKLIVELEGVLFDELTKVIKKEDLKSFLNRYRQFLKHYPGFTWHMATISENLDYVFDGKVLEFVPKEGDDQAQDVIDCGDFIYIHDSGFYPKVSEEGGSKIVSGLKIPLANLESFLHENRADLNLIKGFFAAQSPLDNVLLSVKLSDKGGLVTQPIMVLKPGYLEKDVLWIGSYTFTKKEGFKDVPSEMKMPVLFSHKSRFGLHELFGLLELLQTSLKDRLEIDPRLKIPESLKLEITEISQEKPYAAIGYYFSNLGQTPVSQIKKAYEKGERSICTEAGLIDLTDERFGFLKHLTVNKDGTFSLDPLSFFKLGLYEDVSFSKELDHHPFIESLNMHADTETLDLRGYTSSLRPYQETGVRWLQNLYRLGLSGLLCDEMGLGKTHQAISFIAVLANQKMKLKSLVVCPTSVLYHWEKQLKSFLPHQAVHLYHGPAREFDPKQFEEGIILTSYGVLRSDIELFGDIQFDLAVYDELQIAKNPHSKVYAALSRILTHMKLGLSGTPIENTIEDLKALFDLILPKLLPKASEFKEKFLIPIEKHYDKKARLRLNKVTAPFIMRRLKKDVLKDLPEKVETDMLCEMSPAQEALYHKIVAEQKSSLLNMLSNEKEGTLHVFALLTKLKQLCDHPSLIEDGLDPFKEDLSGKWELFKELLQEARDSGQKVVVFSQYLEMLNIIESYLKKNNIGFASLRGSSMDRKEQVKRFQEDPQCEVFVGSLLASGVGIDLTAASVVIHYDRWWNPAKEAQATDRVHRIGQNRGVQVFKLITKDTIEERIDWLIKDKLRLIDTLSTEEGPDLFKNFTKKELLQLVESLS